MPSHLDAVLDRLEVIAKDDDATARLHDDLIRYLVAANRSLPSFQRFADRVLEQGARASLKKEIETNGPIEANLLWANGKATISANGSSASYSSGGF